MVIDDGLHSPVLTHSSVRHTLLALGTETKDRHLVG